MWKKNLEGRRVLWLFWVWVERETVGRWMDFYIGELFSRGVLSSLVSLLAIFYFAHQNGK